MNRTLISLLASFWCAFCATISAAPVPLPDQAATDALWTNRGCLPDARGQWFRDAKFGAFIHFGAYSQLGGYYHGKGPYDPAEQIMGLGDRHMVIPWKTYQTEVAGAFNPTNFDAHKWVSMIKRAGQKYLVVTTKHHDGFCMFKTATTSYNAVESTPFARDIIKELADECHRQGIAFCPYYSIGDWTAKETMSPQFASYQEYMFAQLAELMTNYGELPMLWLDNYWYVDGQWSNDLSHAKNLYAYLRTLNPKTLVSDRCGRGASSTDGDYATPENQLKGSRQSRYFEVVMTDTDDDNWGWVRGATNYRSADELIHNLVDCTSKGGNFVLNVGPTASGDFPPEHVALLEKIGAWMDVNSEAIYAAVPAPECHVAAASDFDWRATKKDHAIYLHIFHWPTTGPAEITIERADFIAATLLDSALPAPAIQTAPGGRNLKLAIPRPEKTDPYATVLKLTFKNPVTDL